MQTTGKIGIFWVHQGTVLGRPLELRDGVTSGDYIDSPESHLHVWEEPHRFALKFPELAWCDYEHVPRGRVLFHRRTKRFVIYLDTCLMKPRIQTALKKAFGLENVGCTFKADPHYTTDPEAIRRLLD